MNQEMQVLTTAMKASISEVLETMFFLPIDFPESMPEGELSGLQEQEGLTARLDFSGPFSGYGLFHIPRNTAASIAADFLGMDEETVSVDQVRETVMEITNMMLGNTLSCYDRQAVFDLKIPELVDPEAQDQTNSDSQQGILIPIDTLENRLVFKMVIHS